MSLKDKFAIAKQKDRKRWLFAPINGHDSTGYTISFKDAPTEYDAWIAIWKAEVRRIENRKNKDIEDEFEEVLLRLDKPTKSRKQRLLDEWNDISNQDIFTVHLLTQTDSGQIMVSSSALEIAAALSIATRNYDENLEANNGTHQVMRYAYYVDIPRAEAISRFKREYEHSNIVSIRDVHLANIIYYGIGALLFLVAIAILAYLYSQGS